MEKIVKTAIAVLAILSLQDVLVESKQIVRVRGRARQGASNPLKVFSAVPDHQAPEPVARSSSNDCPEPEGLQLYPDEEHCGRFLKCANGTLTYEVCENGLLFDPDKSYTGGVHNFCSYNWDVKCGDRLSDEEPISSPGCEYQFGVFPSSAGCKASYVKCAFGQPTTVSCDLGLVFDQEIRGCNWPDLLIEKQGCQPSKLLGGFECPTSIDQLESDLAKRFYPFPRFPVKGRSDLYVICVDYQPRLQSCGTGNFDTDTLGCVYERLV